MSLRRGKNEELDRTRAYMAGASSSELEQALKWIAFWVTISKIADNEKERNNWGQLKSFLARTSERRVVLIFALHKSRQMANFRPRSRHCRHFLFPLFQSSSLRYAARFMGGKLAAHKVKNQQGDYKIALARE